ncbi:MAG: CHAT domain-containing protein [Hyphomicrobiaceae bacterium]|nr:CHAT domain-containing protein [Hyphomicrobiaceae bacterium]
MPTRLSRAFCAILASFSVAIAMLPAPVDAQESGASSAQATLEETARAYAEAKARADEHVRAGRFKEALSDATETARLSAARNGAESVQTGVALHNLGFIMRRAGRAEDALEPLEKALSIYDRAHPAVHPDIRNVLIELGPFYMKAGRGQHLADTYSRLITRAEREGAGEQTGAAHLLASLGFVLRAIQKDDESLAALNRSLGIYEARGEITGQAYLQVLEAVIKRLEEKKQGETAEARAKAALSLLAQRGAEGASNAVAIYDALSRSVLEAGRAGDAKSYAESALALLSRGDIPARSGRSDPKIGALNNLARASRALADHTTAEDAYKRSIALLHEQGDKANEGIITDNLAMLYMTLGRLTEAERFNKRALSLLEEALGRDHMSVGRAAGNLGVLLNEAGRRSEAEPMLRRALAISDMQPRKDAVQIGIIEDNLAGLLRESGRGAEAKVHYDRALQMFESALPARHPRIATQRNNMGRYFLDMGKYAEAEQALTAALSLYEAIYGKDSFESAIPAANLAQVYTALRRYGEARPLLVRALSALERVYGASHINLLATLNAAGALELGDGKSAAARGYFDRATAAAVEARRRSPVRDGGGSLYEERRAFHGLIEALWREGSGGKRDAGKALETAQFDSMTSTAAALAALGARAGAADPALGKLTRERQDLAAEWVAADKRLTRLLSATATRDAAEEATIRARLAAIDGRLAVLDSDLSLRFPRYHELAQPMPMSLEALRRLIGPGEVAIQFTVTRDATHVFAVTSQDVHWSRAAITERELVSVVRNLRCGLDRAEWIGEGAKRCARLLGLGVAAAPGDTEPLPFDLSRAHELYRVLFGELGAIIAGKDLVVVASGALTSLPLQVLITAPPPEDASFTTTADGRRLTDAASQLETVAWLGRKQAITVLPSLASLGPLRQVQKATRGRAPYIGIGNPLLVGPDGTDRRAFEAPACVMAHDVTADATASLHATSAPTTKSALRKSVTSSTLRSARGDTSSLRSQWPLPETADELCRVAEHARATPSDVIVGAAATEAGVKSMSLDGRLAEARIVHFATHGLLAGETAIFLDGKAEPSLMLTPPDAPSETDDGLLTASEVAGLRLNADWVVLSACNTASGDEVGAEALSGLARAFFYAGARSLLVSHWAVDSDSTVQLVTAAFDAMAREPGMSQARALSGAMAALIDRRGPSAHPSNWAPFVVVGGNAPVLAQAASNVGSEPAAVEASPTVVPPRSLSKKPRRKVPRKTKSWFDEIFQN